MVALTKSSKRIRAEWRIFAPINMIITGSDNGLSPDRRQAIIWNNAGIVNYNLKNKLHWNLKRDSYMLIHLLMRENGCHIDDLHGTQEPHCLLAAVIY